MIVGAVGGPTAIVTAYINLRKAAPEERGMVLDVGQKGINILDGLLDTTIVQLEREAKARERCEERVAEISVRCDERVARLYEDIKAKDDDIKAKDARIRSEQAGYRFMIEEREGQIRECHEELRRLAERIAEGGAG